MSVRSLSSGAEACITYAMELEGDEAEAVRSYVLKRTNTDNFCEMLVYRIVEFVKSFFGASDYQAAKAIIVNSFMNRMMERELIQENPENALESKLKRETSTFFSRVAKGLLDFAFLTQSDNVRDTSELRARWRQLSFSAQSAELAKLRERLPQ